MKKQYFFILLLSCFFSLTVSAQDNRPQVKDGNEELGFYPNPVSNGKIYITSKSTVEKDITIYDVLGKKVLQVTVNSKELNISNLSPGVYIIKIHEGEATATRKLIVK